MKKNRKTEGELHDGEELFFTGCGWGMSVKHIVHIMQKQAMCLRLFQRMSAMLLVALLWVHLHCVKKMFYASGGITYTDVMARIDSPVIKIVEILFFVLAAAHGLSGLYRIVREHVSSPDAARTVRCLFWIVGIGYSVTMIVLIISL